MIKANNAFTLPQPVWTPTAATIAKFSLWDYLGFPLRLLTNASAVPNDWPRRAYNFIWNEYYRDQMLQDGVSWSNELILNRNWEKDYFTIARPNQQLGVEPALPYSTSIQSQWLTNSGMNDRFGNKFIPVQMFPTSNGVNPTTYSPPSTSVSFPSGQVSTTQPFPFQAVLSGPAGTSNVGYQGVMASKFEGNQDILIDGGSLFNVADLRLLFQVQKWMERNMRAGVRYVEFIRSMFGDSPRDERLDRPEYIGGTRSPIIISEVLQTSETGNSAQANMAGHGLTADSTRIGTYRVHEHGLIMTIMSIRPRTAYQDGMPRIWTRRTKYDYQNPLFNHLSEQAVLKSEVYASGTEIEDAKVFGWQPRYDELRYIPSHVAGSMRKIQGQTQLSYWNLVRELSPQVELNSDFVKCVPRKDIFAVTNYPGFIVNYACRVRAVRNIPFISVPGYVDHF